jgi:hypothetical protein
MAKLSVPSIIEMALSTGSAGASGTEATNRVSTLDLELSPLAFEQVTWKLTGAPVVWLLNVNEVEYVSVIVWVR